MRKTVATLIGACGLWLAPALAPAAPDAAPATPAELVATYQSLADTILGAKKSEHGLVKSILAATYRHAEAAHAAAQQALKSGQNARSTVEKLAALVAQIGTLYYFGFFLLMPWWSRLGEFKPVPERVVFNAH